MEDTLVDPILASSQPIWPNSCGSFGTKSLSFASKSPNCGTDAELRRKNAELRQQVGYWKAMHARAMHRTEQLEAEVENSFAG